MTHNLIPVSILEEHDGQPRTRDLDLAERLKIVRPYEIRRTIERHREELEMHGEIIVCRTNNNGGPGRPGKAYWLNEGQALVLCAFSRTAKAAQLRKQLVDVSRHGGTGS
jgi:predicted ArsR family transcriptional regulator